MITDQVRQAARLAALEGAVLALMREAEDQGIDGLHINVEADAGQIAIDLAYTAKGIPVSGESL